MKDLVSRDRNHPSVMFYSFCNEPGCNNGDKSAPTQPSYDFKAVTYDIDGTRPVTGNMCEHFDFDSDQFSLDSAPRHHRGCGWRGALLEDRV